MKKYALASQLTNTAEEKIKELGWDILTFPPNPGVDKRVAHHGDLSFIYLGSGRIFAAAEMVSMGDFFRNLGFEISFSPTPLGDKYPLDVALNCADTGKFLICNVDTASPFVLQYFKDLGRKIIHTRQGYAKCSVIIVDENSIVTDDDSIYREATESGVNALRVKKGAVRLDGYDCGFIGGAAGTLGDTVVFNGSLSRHPDGEIIKSFVENCGKRTLSLSTDHLQDIGSILPLL